MKQYTLIEGSAAIDGVPDNIDSLEWMQGNAESNPSDKAPLLLDLSLESGDYRGDIIDGFLTLYSDEIKDALTEFGIENIEYYPVRLRDQETNETEYGYWLTKINGVLDCVDLDQSKTKPWVTGIGYDFLSMVIDESKTEGLKLFRLKDDPTKVIISEDLKHHLEKSNCLYGVELTLTEDYSDW